MAKTIEGKLIATGKSFALIVSRFNDLITGQLLEGALDCLKRHGTDEKKIDVVWVPGSYELPLTAKKIAASKKHDAVICLGAVIRGGTPHFDFVAAEASKGVAQAGMETGKPIIFGVITTDTIEQAIERAGTKAGNKGWQAALSAIEMADLYAKL